MSFLNRAKDTVLRDRFAPLAPASLIWAHVQPQPQQPGESWITLLIMLALMMIFFYFFLIRPQRKRQQEHQALIESLRRGDEVVTVGGIYGKIVKIEKDYITLQVNEEGTTMRVLKESITQKEKAA